MIPARKSTTPKAGQSRRPMAPIPFQASRNKAAPKDLNNLMAAMNSMNISNNVSGLHPNQAFYANPAFAGVDTDPNMMDETMREEDLEKELKSLFASYENVPPDLPPFKRPVGLKATTKLHPHQEDGIRYLLKNEVDPQPNPFFYTRENQDGKVTFRDRYTNRGLENPHGQAYCLLLFSSLVVMGSGKTLQTIGLILSNPPQGHVYGTAGAMQAKDSVCTLVLCNLSVLPHWWEQFERFTEEGTLRIGTYRGTREKRAKIVKKVQNNELDILLAVYETVGKEYQADPIFDRKTGQPLPTIYDTSFHRVVMDEAHHIRNPATDCSKGVVELANAAKYVLALTGTPYVNGPQDLYPLFAAIRLEPFCNETYYKDMVTSPIRARQRAGLTRVRRALQFVGLRRDKAVAGLDTVVPDKTVKDVLVNFSDGDHKEIYDCLYQLAKASIEGVINGKDREEGDTEPEYEDCVKVNGSALIAATRRVQRGCAGAALVPAAVYNRAAKALSGIQQADGSIEPLSASVGKALLTSFFNEELDHEVVRDKKLPPSPKIFALLQRIHKMGSDEKGVIFSQWTDHLDLIQNSLTEAGYQTARIDGSKNLQDRSNAMKALEEDPKVRFMLCSLGAGGQGIDLSRANVVFLMDPWWNRAQEKQAIDRCHRIGQTRSVRAYRFIMKDSVEEKMRDFQNFKDGIGKGLIKKLTPKQERAAKIPMMLDLFDIKALVPDCDIHEEWV